MINNSGRPGHRQLRSRPDLLCCEKKKCRLLTLAQQLEGMRAAKEKLLILSSKPVACEEGERKRSGGAPSTPPGAPPGGGAPLPIRQHARQGGFCKVRSVTLRGSRG